MLVYISNQLVSATDDSAFKEYIEDGAQKLFGIPHQAWDWGDIKSPDSGAAHAIAVQFTDEVTHLAAQFGRFMLHLAPHVLLIVCLGCLLGMMIGSERCKHWASVAALGAIVTKVMCHVVG